jgi:hypothetical protein
MKTLLVATASLAVLSAPVWAQGAPAAAPSSCFIELRKLMAEPPAGIADLRAAIAQLDERLRPQVEEVNRLKRLAETLAQQQQQAMAAAGAPAEEEGAPPPAAQAPDVARVSQDLRRTNDELAVKQAQLKTDYETQMRAIVGPVQARVGQRAIAFGSQRGCANLKMARAPDLAGLQSAGARDLTGEFVSWYATNKS